MLRAQMSSEGDAFDEQINYLRTKLDESNSETKKLTALITDQTTKENMAGEWEKAINPSSTNQSQKSSKFCVNLS